MPQDQNIPYGFCHCGCGQKTDIACQTARAKGWVRGEPLKWLHGHSRRKHYVDVPKRQKETHYGYCQCGCGEKTKIATRTHTRNGYRDIEGEPIRFCYGHGRRGIGERSDKYIKQRVYAARLRHDGLCQKCWLRKTSGKSLCEVCRLLDNERRAQKKALQPKKLPKPGAGIYPRTKKVRRQNGCRICDADLPKGERGFCETHKEARCELCGAMYLRGYSHSLKRRFCSKRCLSAFRSTLRGPLSPYWKGGISAAQLKERHTKEYKLWRKAVIKRDKATCQRCLKSEGVILCAHHIKEFCRHPELRNEVSNGVTLCEDCHYDVHNKRRPKPWRTGKSKFPPEVQTSSPSLLMMPQEGSEFLSSAETSHTPTVE